ncbi:GGDEF domain-containing protein [uncultured Marinobacter sp.]|uniref:GGDEF domain-containing protein n=1 Tax=uncultured Marinobacter sp. TaxID=187379 RepID=UPI0030D8118D
MMFGRILLLILMLPTAFLPGTALADNLLLDSGWQYRWGDSPFDANGRPEWLSEVNEQDWQDIGFPSNPPGRQGHENAWFRITLPEVSWSDPVVYVYSVDLITEVYLDGEKIYQYGSFANDGGGRFEGWPWHMIPLPETFSGKTLAFRVWSDYTDIGLWGEVRLMDRPTLYLRILNQSVGRLVASAFSLMVVMLALVFALVPGNRRLFAVIGLFSLASAVMILAETQVKQLIWHAPLAWNYLAAGSYYLLPVAMALLFSQWMTGRNQGLLRLVWGGHLVYLVVALGLAATGVINLSSTFPPFDGLFLLSLLILFALGVRHFRAASETEKLILLAILLYSLLLVFDMAVAHGVLAWRRVPVAWGSLAFSLVVVGITLRHYADSQRLAQSMLATLESRVAERTAEMHAMASQERVRSKLLAFEHMKTAMLNDLVSEMQGAGGYHEAQALLALKLPQLARPFAGVFYQRHSGTQDFRLSYAWGNASDRSGFDDLLISPLLDPENQFTPISLENGWLLPIPVQHAGTAPTVDAVILLEPASDHLPGDDQPDELALLLFLQRAVEKISIALSGVRLKEEFEQYSYEDALTGLKNRRFFDELLHREAAIAERMDTPLTVLIADVDKFKPFNDTFGHEAGDEALRLVADSLASSFRDTDVVCRYGGEEFVVIMAGADLARGVERAEAARLEVASLLIPFRGQELGPITVSIGVASWPENARRPGDLLMLADEALYAAKRKGRNRVESVVA